MMEKFKIYSEQQSSDLKWLGEIPSNWSLIRVKYLFSERIEKGFPDKPLLAATQSKGVVKKEDYETHTVTAQKDFHLLKLVKIGDFVISLRSFQGGIEISHEEGIISPAYTILSPGPKINKRYIKHLYKSWFFILSLNRFVTGIREGQNIDYKKFKNSFLPIPPLPEQTSIANFLDQKTAQIDHFIQLKEKTIALLQERKAAIINQAVTRGLDPDVPMKDSGVEWLGEIPVGWEVKKLKYLTTIKGRIGFRGYTTSDLVGPAEGALALGASHIDENGLLKLEKPVFISWDKYYESPEIMVSKDDILIVQRGSTCGKIGLINCNIGKATINPSLVLLKEIKISSRFLNFVLRSRIVTIKVSQTVSSTAIPMLSQEQIGNFLIILPSKDEIEKIVLVLESKLKKIEESILLAQKEIFLIKEYRESLISSAVTGKIDLRSYST